MNEYLQTIKAAKKALPAVVGILVSKKLDQLKKELNNQPSISNTTLEKYLLRPDVINEQGQVKVAGCSGFFVSNDGYILTNRHVVNEKEAFYTVVWQNEKYPIETIYRHPMVDIAVLKCNLRKTPYLILGDSDQLVLGQTVLAIGNALGEFQNTVSRGIISGLSRHLKAEGESGEIEQEFSGLIQTDAAINPGNSGGPLIDLFGRAIGINAVTVLDVENIGFAVPINDAKKVLEQIKKYGKILPLGLGIRYILLDEKKQQEHHLPFNYGAYIIHESDISEGGVMKNSLAEKIGLKAGDIILECEGEKISKNNPLKTILEKTKNRRLISLKIYREGEPILIKAKLE